MVKSLERYLGEKTKRMICYLDNNQEHPGEIVPVSGRYGKSYYFRRRDGEIIDISARRFEVFSRNSLKVVFKLKPLKRDPYQRGIH